MSLKIFSGLNFFYLGLSHRWGSEERMILKDCLMARDTGAEVFLYAYKDSRIATLAKAQGINCLYHQGKFATKIYRWNRLRKLNQLIKKLNIHIVHCYDIKILWPLCFYMRGHVLTSLVFTLNSEISDYYRSFWFRPLVERVDKVLLGTSELVENVWGHMGVPPRKAEFIGMGVKSYKKEQLKTKAAFRFTDERFCIGTNLNGIETNTHFLDTVFHSFRVMIEKGLDDKNYTFVLFNERSWGECTLTHELRRQVKDWGLEEHVAFVGPSDILKEQVTIDLWLGLRRREDLEDYNIGALLMGRPVVVPRTSASMELFGQFGIIGETYLSGDSREIREKCELVLRNLGTYEKNLHKSYQSLNETYGKSSYDEKLKKVYKKVLSRRKRLQRVKRRKRNLLGLRKGP